LNPEHRGGQNVYFPSLNFLQIACGNFGPLSQFLLRQAFADPLPAHVRAEGFDSLPFFSGNGHDILHRYSARNMNDTYIVKRNLDLACNAIQYLENGCAPKKT
jgi:hypothetical protein